MPKEKIRAAVVALGCPKNRVDSEYLLGALAEAGCELTTNLKFAHLIVLTTCAFLQSAVAESEKAIRQLIKLKRRNPNLKLIVAGCLIERYGKRLARRFPGVDQWLGLNELFHIPHLINRKSPPPYPAPLPPRLLSTPNHYAYLKIADGCNNQCRYCLIPKIRGPFRSRPIDELTEEANQLAQLGVKELILIAQDTTLYGQDRYQRPMLSQLIERLTKIKEIRWLRLMYAHPAHLTGEVIEQFATNPKICRYIDLPIQHIADKILTRMNRHYLRRDVEQTLEQLRSIPEMRIRTTIITGLPGETEKEFQELLEFIKTAQFDRLSGYAFSPEPGTPAYRMKSQVPRSLAQRRLHQIMKTQAEISKNKLRSLIGKNVLVLVDFFGLGRTEWDAPEVDGLVYLKGKNPPPGTFTYARVVSTSTYDLTASVCDSNHN